MRILLDAAMLFERERFLQAAPYERTIVFDPCMGSGTTAIAFQQLGRRFIGFEINPVYVEIAQERLKNTSE
jgi:site-specific DNA-methyltransferase (adenine-specific)